MTEWTRTTNSARLTNQRGSYAFSCIPFTIHVSHLLPLPISNMCSDFKRNNDLDIFNIIYFIHPSEQQMWKLWTQFSCLTLPFRGTPVNNGIKHISSKTSVSGLQFCRYSICIDVQIFEQFCLKFRTRNPWHANLKTDFNAKWQFKVIRGHLFRCQWKANKRLYITI